MERVNFLNLGSIQIPGSAATKTFAILAKRGAGKSYTGAVMAEEFYQVGIPFVVFDPIDVWWGLRLHKDGKGKGLPVVVFGKEHADLDLDEEMGPAIAQATVANNISCVLSTFGLSKRAQRKLIAEFSEEILRINNTQRHIFIEEAHEFVPQRISADMGNIFNAVSNLVVMGRNRGIGVTLINQRAATIHKDVLTQIDTLLAFRNVAPQDRQALKEWVEYHAAEGDFAAFMQSLPSLPTGEGWLWSPEFLEKFVRVKIRARQTFHPDREKLGAQGFVMPRLEQADIQRFIEKFRQQTAGSSTPSPKAQKQGASENERFAREKQALIDEYQARLETKEREIAQLREKLAAIRRVVQEGDEGASSGSAPLEIFTSNGPKGMPRPVNSELVKMWMNKLGEGTGAARILSFLAEKHGLRFTRSQIALAVGMSPKSGTYNTYIAHLKKNQLIVEQDDMFSVSPNLVQ